VADFRDFTGSAQRNATRLAADGHEINLIKRISARDVRLPPKRTFWPKAELGVSTRAATVETRVL